MWADLVVHLPPLLDRHVRLVDNLVVHRQVCQRSSKPRILLLQVLQSLDSIELQTAIFGTPAVEDLLGDAVGPADLSNRLSLG